MLGTPVAPALKQVCAVLKKNHGVNNMDQPGSTSFGSPITGSACGTGHGGASPSLGEKAKDVIAEVADKARQAACSVAEKTEQLASSAAHTAREVGTTIGQATHKVAEGVAAGGDFIWEEGVRVPVQNLTQLIRRHPTPALAVGFSIGLLIARVVYDRRE
jgi:hypothetical protein